ncbi:MAG TPA: aminoglycoside phosphotransferase family protein [Streptosporangiaceae bacterium]|nr:aminoglycoside phosphotransferase family protein [Streptosporangiaceae bacterium]
MLDREFILDAEGRRKLADRFGPAGEAWGDELPGLVEQCCRRWSLTLDQAVSGGTARVYLGRQADGRAVVLKLTPDPGIAADEAAALRAWAGTRQAVDLLEADLGAGALLLEAVRPGTKVSDWPVLPPLHDVAGMLTALRQVPAPGLGSLPGMAEGMAVMFDRTARRRADPRVAALVPPGLVDRARRLALALASDGPAGMVHGDLHPANVLDGGPGRGLVAIDPRPSVGDPDWDAVDWAMTRATSAAEMDARITRLAGLVPGLDAGRLQRWCRAAAVVLAVQRLRQHPPDAAAGLLLDLAAASAGPSRAGSAGP